MKILKANSCEVLHLLLTKKGIVELIPSAEICSSFVTVLLISDLGKKIVLDVSVYQPPALTKTYVQSSFSDF